MTGAEQLGCRELVELVTEYLDDALTPADREAFRAHLEGCRECQVHVEQIRRTIRALGDLSAERLSGAARAELLASFRRWTGGP